MAKKFLLYINDDSIKVYHANGRVVNFYAKYDIENPESFTGLIGLLNKYNWGIYVFLDSSEVSVEKKVFDRGHAKDIAMIIKNHSQRSDLLISCVLPNEPEGHSKLSKAPAKEYAIFSIANDTYPNLKSLINTIANNKSRVHVVNFMPLCISTKDVVVKEKNVVNLVVRLRANRSYTIDVFYGHSFVVHRDDTLGPRTSIAREIEQTITYVDTIIAEPNISFVTTIYTEVAIARDDLSSVRSEVINVVQASDVPAKLGSRAVVHKGSDSEIDDTFVAMVFSKNKYHVSFSNKTLAKKAMLFRVLPFCHMAIALLFFGLLANEAKNIIFKMPGVVNKSDKIEKEMISVQQELAKLKKIAINKNTVAFVESCGKLQQIDKEKIDYISIVKRLHAISETYVDTVMVIGHQFNCSGKCYSRNAAQYSMGLHGLILNPSGVYEDMMKTIKSFTLDLQTAFPEMQVSLPTNDLSPEFGKTYKSFAFSVIMSGNASQKG